MKIVKPENYDDNFSVLRFKLPKLSFNMKSSKDFRPVKYLKDSLVKSTYYNVIKICLLNTLQIFNVFWSDFIFKGSFCIMDITAKSH